MAGKSALLASAIRAAINILTDLCDGTEDGNAIGRCQALLCQFDEDENLSTFMLKCQELEGIAILRKLRLMKRNLPPHPDNPDDFLYDASVFSYLVSLESAVRSLDQGPDAEVIYREDDDKDCICLIQCQLIVILRWMAAKDDAGNGSRDRLLQLHRHAGRLAWAEGDDKHQMHALVCLQLWRTDEMMWIDDEAMLKALMAQSCSASSSIGAAALSLSVLSAAKVEESAVPTRFLLTASTMWLGHPQRSEFLDWIQIRIRGLTEKSISNRDRLLGLLSLLCLYGYVFEAQDDETVCRKIRNTLDPGGMKRATSLLRNILYDLGFTDGATSEVRSAVEGLLYCLCGSKGLGQVLNDRFDVISQSQCSSKDDLFLQEKLDVCRVFNENQHCVLATFPRARLDTCLNWMLAKDAVQGLNLDHPVQTEIAAEAWRLLLCLEMLANEAGNTEVIDVVAAHTVVLQSALETVVRQKPGKNKKSWPRTSLLASAFRRIPTLLDKCTDFYLDEEEHVFVRKAALEAEFAERRPPEMHPLFYNALLAVQDFKGSSRDMFLPMYLQIFLKRGPLNKASFRCLELRRYLLKAVAFGGAPRSLQQLALDMCAEQIKNVCHSKQCKWDARIGIKKLRLNQPKEEEEFLVSVRGLFLDFLSQPASRIFHQDIFTEKHMRRIAELISWYGPTRAAALAKRSRDAVDPNDEKKSGTVVAPICDITPLLSAAMAACESSSLCDADEPASLKHRAFVINLAKYAMTSKSLWTRVDQRDWAKDQETLRYPPGLFAWLARECILLRGNSALRGDTTRANLVSHSLQLLNSFMFGFDAFLPVIHRTFIETNFVPWIIASYVRDDQSSVAVRLDAVTCLSMMVRGNDDITVVEADELRGLAGWLAREGIRSASGLLRVCNVTLFCDMTNGRWPQQQRIKVADDEELRGSILTFVQELILNEPWAIRPSMLITWRIQDESAFRLFLIKAAQMSMLSSRTDRCWPGVQHMLLAYILRHYNQSTEMDMYYEFFVDHLIELMFGGGRLAEYPDFLSDTRKLMQQYLRLLRRRSPNRDEILTHFREKPRLASLLCLECKRAVDLQREDQVDNPAYTVRLWLDVLGDALGQDETQRSIMDKYCWNVVETMANLVSNPPPQCASLDWYLLAVLGYVSVDVIKHAQMMITLCSPRQIRRVGQNSPLSVLTGDLLRKASAFLKPQFALTDGEEDEEEAFGSTGDELAEFDDEGMDIEEGADIVDQDD